MNLKRKGNSYDEDTIMDRIALLCWLIILSPIVLISFIIWKSLIIRDRIHEWLMVKNII